MVSLLQQYQLMHVNPFNILRSLILHFNYYSTIGLKALVVIKIPDDGICEPQHVGVVTEHEICFVI